MAVSKTARRGSNPLGPAKWLYMVTEFKKWVQLSFLACGLLGWVFLRELFALVFEPLGWLRLSWIISPADIVAILCGTILFVVLLRWEKAGAYLTDVFSELTKVTWPKGKETFMSTGVVSVLIGLATLSILLFDSVWSWVAQKFLYI